MNELGAQAAVAISGKLVYRDAAGNVVKEVPFEGKAPLDVPETKESEEDGDVR